MAKLNGNREEREGLGIIQIFGGGWREKEGGGRREEGEVEELEECSGKRGWMRAEKGGVWFGGFSWEWPA